MNYIFGSSNIFLIYLQYKLFFSDIKKFLDNNFFHIINIFINMF